MTEARCCLLIGCLLLSASAHADEPPSRTVRYVPEVGVGVPWIGGDPTMNFFAGVEIVSARLVIGGRFQLPDELNEFGKASIFKNGKDLVRIRWHGETALVARYRPVASLGLDIQASIGGERWDLVSSTAAKTTNNGFATIGPGWNFALAPTTLYVRLSVNAVFLYGGGSDFQVGDVKTGYKTLFFFPELSFGGKF